MPLFRQWAERNGSEVSRRSQALVGPAKMATVRDVYSLPTGIGGLESNCEDQDPFFYPL